jgi:CheY-like chemotaxis protein
MSDQALILLAEDDENDIYLMRRAFQRAAVPNPVQIVRNGQEAIDYLQGTGDYSQRDRYPLPGMLLLDLKLPWLDGFDVLAWLRKRPEFNTLPVIVLTSSKLQSDVDRSRDLGVHDFRVKPASFEDLVRLLDDVRKCWLEEKVRQAPG